MDDQSFEVLLNNFARLTNIISHYQRNRPNFCSVQICFWIVAALRGFKLCALKVKGLENFRAFAFCLKL